MRIRVKISMPVEAGNKAARDEFRAISRILEEQKPEAAYFIDEKCIRPLCWGRLTAPKPRF